MADRDPNEARWVEAALRGEEEGYRRLVERYQRPVFGLLLRMVGDRPLAEDLAQETFIKAFRALESFQRGRKLSSWLFKIAHNTGIDHLRRKSLDTVPIETDEEGPDLLDALAGPAHDSPESVLRRRRLVDALEEAMEALRPDYRTVLELRFREGLAYEEISEVADLPLGTVKTHLHRARKALARNLHRLGWSADDA